MKEYKTDNWSICALCQQGWRMYAGRVCACTQRTGAAARESLRRDRPGRLTSPAFHACGSASSFRARCCHNSQKQYIRHPSKVCALHMLPCVHVCAQRLGLPRACHSGLQACLARARRCVPRLHLCQSISRPRLFDATGEKPYHIGGNNIQHLR